MILQEVTVWTLIMQASNVRVPPPCGNVQRSTAQYRTRLHSNRAMMADPRQPPAYTQTTIILGMANHSLITPLRPRTMTAWAPFSLLCSRLKSRESPVNDGLRADRKAPELHHGSTGSAI